VGTVGIGYGRARASEAAAGYHDRVLPAFVLDQLSRPRGPLAPLTALVLNGVNARTIMAAISALELRPGQRVVEVGFGGGLSLPLLLRKVGARGQVFALEASAEMLARVRRLFIIPRLQGRLQLEHARIEKLPLGDSMFDAAMSLNTIMFWTDVDDGMRELARVLAPGARLVLGIPDPEQLQREGFAARGFRIVVPERLGARLPDYGFELLELRVTADNTTLVVARRNDDGDDDL
jgi:arsenite methyltransferase